MPFTIFESPFGPLTLIAGAYGLRRLYFPRRAPALEESDRDPQRLAAAVQQLVEEAIFLRRGSSWSGGPAPPDLEPSLAAGADCRVRAGQHDR